MHPNRNTRFSKAPLLEMDIFLFCNVFFAEVLIEVGAGKYVVLI